MNRYLAFIIIFFSISVLFIVKTIFLCDFVIDFPAKTYDSIPRRIEGVTALLAFFIYLGIMIYLFRREKKMDSDLKWRNSFSWYWFLVKPFLSRYKNVKFVVLFYSLMITCYIYSISIPITYSFIVYYNSEVTYLNNPLSFFHSQGIIISFIGMFFVVFTFLNTIIIKVKYDREIETFEELFYIIKEKLGDKKIWGKYSNIFYYIFDYTIATGHYSNPTLFCKYAEDLRKFLSHYRVDFKGLILNYDKNLEYYMRLIDDGRNRPEDELRNEAKRVLIEANDAFITYLNKTYWRAIEKPEEIQDKIRYQPYRTQSESLSHEFFKSKLRMDYLPATDDDCIRRGEALYGRSSIYQTEEIGITRFIITNIFVIQFIATKEKSKNVVTGYISEDLTAIERYKNTFCDYREMKHIH